MGCTNWNLGKVVPGGFWNDIENHCKFWNHVAKELRILNPEAWYTIHRSSVMKCGGTTLLRRWGSAHTALTFAYPEYLWQPWRFESTPRGFWYDTGNQVLYLEWLAQQMNIECPEDWYKLQNQDIINNKGATLLYVYGASVCRMLSTLYSEYSWQPWRFEWMPRKILEVPAHLKAYIDWLSRKLFVQEMEDWYDVSVDHLKCFKGRHICLKENHLHTILSNVYSSFRWKDTMFARCSKKTQKLLFRIVKNILPEETEVLFDVSLFHVETEKRTVQVDLYIPSLKIAMEYQGEQHFRWNTLFGSSKEQQKRDGAKKAACVAAGITMLEVPYWWKLDKERFKAFTVVRMDVLRVNQHLGHSSKAKARCGSKARIS